jgi:ubiquinone/menaquinone biosynthesis C-methylase UbiE
MNSIPSIDARYSSLAKTTSNLSCGGAIRYADTHPGEVCLDLGSGRGNDCVKLAEKAGASGHVYGIDISDGMLEKARATIAQNQLGNIDLIKSPIEIIPLPDNSVDLVISNCTINHAENKNAVWSEVFRILKAHGRFVVSDIYSLDPVPEIYKTDPGAVAECWAGAVTKPEYLQTLDACGFENVAILEESEPYKKREIFVSSFTIKGYKPAKNL